jgi:ribosome-binding protein aMBF1 (putative translation factor)
MPKKKTYSDTLLDKLMENPEFRDEYHRTQPFAEIAMEVVRVRSEAGLSQTELARKIGTSQSAIARIECLDYGKVNIQTLQKIADALGLKLQVQFMREAG